jgi:Zn-dependent peptidase ImmA (M78 family)
VLRWARERVRLEPEQLARKVQVKPERVREWEESGRISVAQADKLAHHTHTPLGFLYLPNPPEDSLPIPDFRTRNGNDLQRPSPDLLETVYLMQRRQAWMRDEVIEEVGDPLSFVGAFGENENPKLVAAAMRDALQLQQDWAYSQSTWTDALSHLREQADRVGVLVVFSGIVGNNTHRKLDTDEFQGFALVDEFAPLVFVNSADFQAAQMFTLAHELAHLFVGESGVTSFDDHQAPAHETEQSCNRVAAEFLAPEEELRAIWPTAENTSDPHQTIARHFKVSTLVAARRALDLKLIDLTRFLEFYEESKATVWLRKRSTSPGGDFWNTQRWRIGPRFGAAVARATREGRLLYQEAYGLTGLNRVTFEKLPEKFGVIL